MGPVQLALIICAAICLFTWTASVLTRDSSWVDRMWSIAPVIYVWVFAGYAGLADMRLNVMAIIVTLWGARLTFNFARKGGYSGMEDYRWPIVRATMKPWQYQIFNIFFIVLFQNALLLLIAMPAYVAYENQASAFGLVGVVLTAAFLAALAGETIADQQQWNFHQWKRAETEAGRTVSPGFMTRGLFSVSRHPNFFAEQAQWWVIFLFGAVAAGSIAQWTVIGAFLLTLLFLGSTRFTEAITLSKYPEYAQYQRRVSVLIPWWPRKNVTIPGQLSEQTA